jgi:hypothetical protein
MPAPQSPPRVQNIEDYWTSPPPARSKRCEYWIRRINEGWTRNRRISAMGYHESANFFGVYIWEYLHVLSPRLNPDATHGAGYRP